MTRVRVSQPVTFAPRDNGGMWFTPGVFDHMIGTDIPVDTPAGRRTGRVIEVPVSEDRRSITLVIEVDLPDDLVADVVSCYSITPRVIDTGIEDDA